MEFVERFHREAKSAARLSHPNIVSVYDVGEDRGVHYIVMELKGENYLNSLYEEMKGQNAKVDQDLLTKLFLQNIGIDKQ